MGIDENEPRPFTVTGGVPYFGGAGNAYTLMSVALMAQKLRANPPKARQVLSILSDNQLRTIREKMTQGIKDNEHNR